MKKAVSMFLVIVFLVSLSGCAGDTNSRLDDNTRKKVTQVINGYCSSLKNHDIESFGKYVSKDIKDLYKQYRKEALDPITECKVLLIELDNAKFDKNNPPKKIAKKRLTVPGTVKTIDDFAFSQNKTLTKVTLPKKLKKIGMSAFANVKKIKSITIPKSVNNIEDAAFIKPMKLKGYKKSVAETYAKAYGLKFIKLG